MAWSRINRLGLSRIPIVKYPGKITIMEMSWEMGKTEKVMDKSPGSDGISINFYKTF